MTDNMTEDQKVALVIAAQVIVVYTLLYVSLAPLIADAVTLYRAGWLGWALGL